MYVCVVNVRVVNVRVLQREWGVRVCAGVVGVCVRLAGFPPHLENLEKQGQTCVGVALGWVCA